MNAVLGMLAGLALCVAAPLAWCAARLLLKPDERSWLGGLLSVAAFVVAVVAIGSGNSFLGAAAITLGVVAGAAAML